MDRLAAVSMSLFLALSLFVGFLPAATSLESSSDSFGVSNAADDHWATAGGGTGADMVWDMVLDSQGNSYVTGSFSGSAIFGSTTLNSVGGLDGFVAKMDSDGNWLWASQISGAYEDWGLGIDVDSTGNVYVIGPFMDSQGAASPTVQLGSFSLSAHSDSTYDMFVGKLDNNGNWGWAQTSNKIDELDQNTWTYVEQFGQVMPTDVKVFNNSVTVSGSYNGKIFAYTDSQGDWYYESTQGTSDAYVGFLDVDGVWGSQHGWGGTSQFDSANSIAPSPSGNYWYLAGTFADSVDFIGGTTLSSSGGSVDVWVMQITDGGNIEWTISAGGTGTDTLRDMVVDDDDSVYAVGEFDGVLASYGNDRLTANSGGTDVWLGKIVKSGTWQWAKKAGGASDDMGFSLSLSTNQSTVYATGQVAGQVTFENSQTTLMVNSNGASDAFVSQTDALTGEWQNVFLAGGPSGGDRGWAIDVDSADVVHTAGRFKGTVTGPGEFGSDELSSAGDFDIFVWKGLIEDDDSDRVANEDDDCPETWGNATVEPYVGCIDSDGDGYADVDDSHPIEPTQWRDQDGDTYGDNPNGTLADDCPTVNGTSTIDILGCTDSDSDGWSNQRDAFPAEPTQWNDSDMDGFGDNWDNEELTAAYVSLGLGHYVPMAVDMDYCPTIPGVWTFDNPGCPDTDEDGYSDVSDDFINNPTQWKDTDGDGWGDNSSHGATQRDDLPFDETQWQDRDGDGWGDDPDGNSPDQYPDDWTQQVDFDGDEYGDNSSGTDGDICPDEYGKSWRDRLGCPDSDGDGTSDVNDEFPDDWSQWDDSDGDGLGDNWANPHWNDSRLSHWPGEFIPGAQNADRNPLDRDGDGFEDEGAPSAMEPFDDCPDEPGRSWADRSGCPDLDDDGWSNPNDIFPNEPSQWRDSDRDGFGDEGDGVNADDCVTIRGDSEHDRLGCPDTDGDGWSDPMEPPAQDVWNISQGADMFPADPLRWNQSHIISEESGGFGTDGGMAAGLGLGALIALMFAMVFGILVMRMRGRSEYDDDDDDDDFDESEADEGRTSRAADIARSWQEHGTAPPPAPEGAEMATTSANVVYAPPVPTTENTLSSPSGKLPPAPMPPSEPMQLDENSAPASMTAVDAMSLLDYGSNEDGQQSDDESQGEETPQWGIDDTSWGEEE